MSRVRIEKQIIIAECKPDEFFDSNWTTEKVEVVEWIIYHKPIGRQIESWRIVSISWK